MARNMIVSKKLLERLRAAFKRYGNEVINDPDITIDFLPTQFDDLFSVLLTSPNFERMRFGERQNSIWEYLEKAPEVTTEDLSHVTSIATEAEAIELI